MNKQIFNQDEALFAAFEEAKQTRNFLLAEQLAQKIYQKYPSLDNHYCLVDLYLMQDFQQKAYEVALEEQDNYERSAKYLPQFTQLTIMNYAFLYARRLLLRNNFPDDALDSLNKQLTSAEEFYASIYVHKLQEKYVQWQAALTNVRPIFNDEFQLLTSQLPLATFQTIIQELLPNAQNPFLIAKTCELMNQLELSMDIYLKDVFTEENIKIASSALTAPNEQPFIKTCEQILAQSLANEDAALYEMLHEHMIQQLTLTYPFTPPISAKDYIRLTIQLYQTGQISKKEDMATIKQFQLIQEKYQKIIQNLL
ncbi:ABC transporter substrate-binding protein [Enterococcus cecorum]|uniref:ABC transporter substrate-binding protein n=1 Tax=Enterococcus cecorum TaxID=44008 RepID=UPI00200A6706|nr:ABC transporter substrate-binding protein [Enterococcus cecorum]